MAHSQKSERSPQVVSIAWLCVLLYGATFVILMLAGRLGVPSVFLNLGLVTMFAATMIVVAWAARTMTGPRFYYGDYQLASSATGFGGGTDVVGGALLLTFASAAGGDKLVLGPAIMIGLVLCGVLFASQMRRSGVATAAGYLGWRYQQSAVGTVAVLISTIILALILLAEFEVARLALAALGRADAGAMTWIVLVLAAIPPLLGGWLSIAVTNLVLSLWITLSLLLPTLLLGLVPGLMGSDAAQLVSGSDIPNLAALPPPAISREGIVATGSTLVVIACGIAAFPHTLARLSLVRRPSSAIEHMGWSALFAFIALAGIGFTLALILPDSSASLSQTLRGQPALHMLPYAALALAAVNGMSVTLFALSAAIARGVQRARAFDPNERTMFGSRLIVALVCLVLGWFAAEISLPVATLLIWAICLSAGCLFVPVFAAVWMAKIPGTATLLSMLAGLGVLAEVARRQLETGFDNAMAPIPATLMAMGAAAFVIAAGRIWWHFRMRGTEDHMLKMLRGASA